MILLTKQAKLTSYQLYITLLSICFNYLSPFDLMATNIFDQNYYLMAVINLLDIFIKMSKNFKTKLIYENFVEFKYLG